MENMSPHLRSRGVWIIFRTADVLVGASRASRPHFSLPDKPQSADDAPEKHRARLQPGSPRCAWHVPPLLSRLETSDFARSLTRRKSLHVFFFRRREKIPFARLDAPRASALRIRGSAAAISLSPAGVLGSGVGSWHGAESSLSDTHMCPTGTWAPAGWALLGLRSRRTHTKRLKQNEPESGAKATGDGRLRAPMAMGGIRNASHRRRASREAWWFPRGPGKPRAFWGSRQPFRSPVQVASSGGPVREFPSGSLALRHPRKCRWHHRERLRGGHALHRQSWTLLSSSANGFG